MTQEEERPRPQQEIELPVFGMTCRGCVQAIETRLQALPGVRAVHVDLAGKRVRVACGPSASVTPEALAEAVEGLGFRASAPKAEASRMPWSKFVSFLLLGLVLLAAGTYTFQRAQTFYLSGGTIQNLNEFFGRISPWAVGLAFLFGLVVAFSPASYAMAPAVMGYVSGAKRASGWEALKLSGAFVAGIVTVEMAIGALFAVGGAAAIAFFSGKLPLWYALVTLILLALALMTWGIWRVDLPVLRPRWRDARSAWDAYLLGMPFGLIACPACTPLLLPVALGATATGQAWYGATLMGAFALGRGLPLAALGTSAGAFRALRGLTPYVPWIEKAVGLLLLAGALWFFKEFLRVSQAFGLF